MRPLRAHLSALAAMIVLAGSASGQLSFGGLPPSLSDARGTLPPLSEVMLPAADEATLLAEDAHRAAVGDKRFRFGTNRTTDLTTTNSGRWDTLPNGDRLWRLGIHCSGARSINFEFNVYMVPEGGRVWVYDPVGHVLGAFTAASNPSHTELGVGLLPSEHITVEYLEPRAVAGQGLLRIGQVTHGYRDLGGDARGFGSSGACNVNVVCPQGDGWRDQIRSVARIMVGGNILCTGQLINDCAQDALPYFLTANHCVALSNPATWVVVFNWQSPVCTPNTNAPMDQTVSGTQLLVNNSASDVALVQLNTPPPASYNVHFGGWDRGGGTPQRTTVIHHPSGDVKKISSDNDAPTQTIVNYGTGNAQCWRVLGYESGTTEGGSSGSALWDPSGRIIGQLYGGNAACSNNDWDDYGRFDISYPFLQPWLGDCGNILGGLDPSLGIHETSSTDGLRVWPSPGDGRFTLALPADMRGALRLRITDAAGRTVQDRAFVHEGAPLALDLGTVPGGLYFLELHSADRMLTTRIVVD